MDIFKKHPLRLNSSKNYISQSFKNFNSPKNIKGQRFIYSPSITSIGRSSKLCLNEQRKKHKSLNKNSLGSLPIFTTIETNRKSKNGKIELFARNKKSNIIMDLNEENMNDEKFLEIELLWDELGIKDEYQDQFELYLSNIDNSTYKNKILILEKNNLIELKEELIEFMNEKENRYKNIDILKQLNNKLKANNNNNQFEPNKEVVKQIVECIKEIRKCSVNIVMKLIKIRENLNCFSIESKINVDIINKKYYFDNNYLSKMNSEIYFLKNSDIYKIFAKNNNELLDTFLTLFYKKIKIGDEIISDLIPQELLNDIDKCRYYMVQNSFWNNIKNKKNVKIKENNVNSKKIYNKFKENQKSSPKRYIDVNNTYYMNIYLHKLKTKLGDNYNNIFLNSNRQNTSSSNRKYNFFKNESKKKSSNLFIERDYSPYKTNYNYEFSYKNIFEHSKNNDKLNKLKAELIDEGNLLDFDYIINNELRLDEEYYNNKKNKIDKNHIFKEEIEETEENI